MAAPSPSASYTTSLENAGEELMLGGDEGQRDTGVDTPPSSVNNHFEA
jgi:hypothetical protein